MELRCYILLCRNAAALARALLSHSPLSDVIKAFSQYMVFQSHFPVRHDDLKPFVCSSNLISRVYVSQNRSRYI